MGIKFRLLSGHFNADSVAVDELGWRSGWPGEPRVSCTPDGPARSHQKKSPKKKQNNIEEMVPSDQHGAGLACRIVFFSILFEIPRKAI